VAAGPSTARSTLEEAGTRATLPRSRWSVGGRWRARAAGWVGAAAAALAAERPGRPGRRAVRPSRAAARWARVRAVARGGCPAAWLPSSSWVRDHGGWSSPRLTPGWAVPEGHWRCRRGWACGPSAAQAGSERAWLDTGSALTCDDRWWACQDLNLGPHPYQACSRDAFMLVERGATSSSGPWR
jgi:hypothetical protein